MLSLRRPGRLAHGHSCIVAHPVRTQGQLGHAEEEAKRHPSQFILAQNGLLHVNWAMPLLRLSICHSPSFRHAVMAAPHVTSLGLILICCLS